MHDLVPKVRTQEMGSPCQMVLTLTLIYLFISLFERGCFSGRAWRSDRQGIRASVVLDEVLHISYMLLCTGLNRLLCVTEIDLTGVLAFGFVDNDLLTTVS